MAWLQQQQQIILRLPEDLARLARKTIYKDKTKANTAFSVRPLDEAAPSNDFIFTLNDQDYPALLMNLPTLLESHKTFDNKIFIKSGDIGQVLQVFHTIEEKETARSNICKTVHGDYMPSGITPPTHDIVRRKFEKTRRNEGDFIPYRIRQIAQEINDFGIGTGRFINPTTGVTINEEDINQNSTNNSGSGSGSSGVEVMQEFVNEEVVDFEEWMADHSSAAEEWMANHHSSGYEEQQYSSSSSSYQPQGVSLTFNSNQLLSSRELLTQNTKEAQMLMLLLQHPEVLVTEEEREEDDIDALAAEQNKEKRNRELSLNNATAAVATSGSTTTTATTGSMDVEASDTGVPTTTTATATTSSSANSSEPLKLSLNMLRNPTTTTAPTSTSKTNNIVRLQITDNADEDMAQDDEGDEEETELNGETENMNEHEEVENESEGEDYDSKEGDQEGDEEGQVTNRTGDVLIGSSGSGVTKGMDMYGSNSGTATTTMYAPPVEVEEIVEEGGSNNDHDDVVGAEEVKGDDESSVNSSDSDAWMKEV